MKKILVVLLALALAPAVTQAATKKKAAPTPTPTIAATNPQDNETSGRDTVKALRKTLVGKDTATSETLKGYAVAMKNWQGSLEPRSMELRKEQMEYERARRDLQFLFEAAGLLPTEPAER